MLISIFRSGLPAKLIIPIAVMSALTVLISLTVHECCHGLCAYALGDPTAKQRGRLSLNPMRHLNPIGTICMLLLGFGWANPVPINPNYFKNRKVGMALTAFAGPLSNLLLSFLSLIFYTLLLLHAPTPHSEFTNNLLSVVSLFLYYMHIMNINLAVFNLIPIPPLDGSRILNIFIPEDKYFKIMRYEKYIALALVFLIYFGALTGPLSFITNKISLGMQYLVGLFIK